MTIIFQQLTISHLHNQLFAPSLCLLIWWDGCRRQRGWGWGVLPAAQSADRRRLECSPPLRPIKAHSPAYVRVCVCARLRDPALRMNKHTWWMDGRRSEHCDGGLGIIQKKKEEKKERLAFMIRETSKRISLPKHGAQSCQAASRERRGDCVGWERGVSRWDVSLCSSMFFWRKNPNLC